MNKVDLGVHISIKLLMSLKKAGLKYQKLTGIYEETDASGEGEGGLSGL